MRGRLRVSGAPERACHETTYRFVYGAPGQHLRLYQELPIARRRRRTHYQRKPHGFTIPDPNTIEQRPSEIAARSRFGHWEGDLMIFRRELGSHNLTSPVERRSRYTILTGNPNRGSNSVQVMMFECSNHLTLPQHLSGKRTECRPSVDQRASLPGRLCAS